MPREWTWEEAQALTKPAIWSWEDVRQQRPEPVDLRDVTPDNYMRQAADRIQYYQRERDAQKTASLSASEQVAIQDAYRQLAGLQPNEYYLTRAGAIPKDRFYEIRATRTKDSAWKNWESNVANTLLQSVGGLTTVGGKITDTLQITDDAVEKWQKNLDETTRILAPSGGLSGALGQIVGTTMFALLGGLGGADSAATWAQRLKSATPIAGMFGVSAAGQTFGEVARRRLQGQNIGMLNEWTAAIGNGAIETTTELFGWAAARHLAGGLVKAAPGLRRALAEGGWRGARSWLGKFVKTTIGDVLVDVPQGYLEEFLAQVGQDTTNKLLGITPEADYSEFLGRAHEAGLMGAAQVALLGGILGAGRVVQNRLGPDGTPLPPTKPTEVIPLSEDAIKGVEKAAQGRETLPPELRESTPAIEHLPDIREPGAAPIQALTDTWIGDRQVDEMKADIDAGRKHKTLKKLAREGETTQQVNESMHLYIDMKNNPSDYSTARIAKLPADKQAKINAVAQMSQEQIELAEQIIAENRELGLLAKDQELLTNFQENYTARLWEKPDETRRHKQKAKFTTTTARVRQRTLGSILEGWERGLELQVPGAIEAQQIARQQITQVVHDRNLIELGIKNDIFSIERQRDWSVVKHPNFQKWTWAGKAEAGKSYGPGVFISPDGNLFHRVPLYAPTKLAKYLNNALGSSALYGIPGVGTITKYNAIIKQQVLFLSLFHHQAFLRSYMLGSRKINPKTAYREGKQAFENFIPELQLLVHEGLTIGRIQDFQQLAAQQSTWIGQQIDKVSGPKEVKDRLVKWKDQQIDFLFHKLGPYLKTYAALIDYRARVKANQSKLIDGKISHREIANAVATELNNDFGGMNLQRIGRNPELQHIFQLLALAPDWTESNIRSMTAAFKRGEMGKVHRLMWSRIALKGFGAIILSNLMLSGFDDEKFWTRYRKAWKAGWKGLKWMDVDVTPIYRALGGSDGKRKYFNLLGHFRDPMKFMARPVRAARGKFSILSRLAWDAGSGEDWRGRQFSSVGDLLKKGEVVKWEPFGSGAVEWEQVPSFLIWQAKQATPIQVQAGVEWMSGHIDAWDTITRSLGLMTSGAKEPAAPKLRKKRRKRRRKRRQ